MTDDATDHALRDDVRLLGAMVGDMLREQEGEQFFGWVEGARQEAGGGTAGGRARAAP